MRLRPLIQPLASRYLTLRQVAEYLGYRGKRGHEAARKFVARRGLRKFWRGRAWLVKQSDIDATLAGRPVRTRRAA